jgi:hypothetical protein
VRQFFQNLLPEGQALEEDAALANKVSKANLMGLLIALGQDTAGALTSVWLITLLKRRLSQPRQECDSCPKKNYPSISVLALMIRSTDAQLPSDSF